MKTLWSKLWGYMAGLWRSLFVGSVPPAKSTTSDAGGHTPHEHAPIYMAEFVEDDDDLPRQLKIHTVYIIGIKGNEWLAIMTCPCGCSCRLPLNLLQDEDPYWTWSVSPSGAATLSPSVWRKVGCRSHFFLRRGHIQWCPSQPEEFPEMKSTSEKA